MSLVNIILAKITDNNFSIELNNNEIIFLQTFISKNPDKFNAISENIKNITVDGELNLHDIPEIILLVSNLFDSDIIKTILDDVDIINIIQFTIDTLINSGLFPFSTIELSTLTYIINSSLALLRTNFIFIKNEKKEPKVNCFSCFPCIFKLCNKA